MIVGRNETFEVSHHDFVNSHTECFFRAWYPRRVWSVFSVQLSLIALFRKLDLDLLKNSALPLLEKSCGTYHEHCEPWSSVHWDDAKRKKPRVWKSYQACKKLITSLWGIPQLQSWCRNVLTTTNWVTNKHHRMIKGKQFHVFNSASENEISDVWESLHFIDPSIEESDSSKAVLSSRPQLQAFMEHCCRQRHYTFCIKKCGNAECHICSPVRIDTELFRPFATYLIQC